MRSKGGGRGEGGGGGERGNEEEGAGEAHRPVSFVPRKSPLPFGGQTCHVGVLHPEFYLSKVYWSAYAPKKRPGHPLHLNQHYGRGHAL